MNIAWNAITKQENPELGYEDGFLEQLEESIGTIVSKGIKVITNAGALNTPCLAREVQKLCNNAPYGEIVVAAVIGDDISALLHDKEHIKRLKLSHLDHEDERLSDWDMEPLCGNAYIGAGGIRAALDAGADIIICGRVTDASPVIGAAAWWHGWQENNYDALAGALVAGHLIECGPYVCGANFSGFKDFTPGLVDLGFPIAEIGPQGDCIITKMQNWAGRVTRFTVTAQFLYELQGELYLNPDVVADLSNVKVEETEVPDRVHVSGARGSPPPPTTKAIIAASGGFQAETTFYINGLDAVAKADMMKAQIFYAFRSRSFSKLSVELYGSPKMDPSSQQEGTLMLRVFAQARRKEDIDKDRFLKPIYALRMQSYPGKFRLHEPSHYVLTVSLGYHMSLDFRTMQPKPFMEMFPALVPVNLLSQQVIIQKWNTTIPVPAPARTACYPLKRPSYETSEPDDLSLFGPTIRVPLGSIVHARSGDKADNSNVGLFVRHEDEYPWLKSLLTISKLKELFAQDWKEREGISLIERCEFPHVLAVHL